jgi:hypothetical protein
MVRHRFRFIMVTRLAACPTPSPALFSMIAFIIVTDLFRTSVLPDLAYTQLGMAWHVCPIILLNFIPQNQVQRGSSTCCHGFLASSLCLGSSGPARRPIRVTSGLLVTALIGASLTRIECVRVELLDPLRSPAYVKELV